MINLQLELPRHIDSIETLTKDINERLQEGDSQGIVHVSQVLWNGAKEEWFYLRHFQVKEKFEPSPQEKEELVKAITISKWWFIS